MNLRDFTQIKTGKYALILLLCAGIIQSILPWLIYFTVFDVIFVDLILILVPCLIAFGVAIALVVVPTIKEVETKFFLELAYATLVSALVIAAMEIFTSAMYGIQYVGYFPIIAMGGLVISIGGVVLTHLTIRKRKTVEVR
ncbi:MAG: hypothetical protein ACTSQF_02465 [Candidatus Heimdallarchaeaceae archaeon]